MNLKLVLEYDGTFFAGWQAQPQNSHQKTIQNELTKAISSVLQQNISLIVAGRTDAGVHAKSQVANFHIATQQVDFYRLRYSLNQMLRPFIYIKEIQEANEDFSARFSAKSREYRYFLTEEYSPLNGHFMAYYPPKKYGVENFEVSLMNEACQIIKEHKDFASFCRAKHQSKTSYCTISKAVWSRTSEKQLVFQIVSNRFLRGMVRLIVGAMIEVGAKRVSLKELEGILKKRDVRFALPSAPASGLYLWNVEY